MSIRRHPIDDPPGTDWMMTRYASQDRVHWLLGPLVLAGRPGPWDRGQSMGTGQANVKAYNRQLRDLIAEARQSPPS